ncbi:MAG: heme-binding domain-containing protein, partial [Gemmataceae bacterium]
YHPLGLKVVDGKVVVLERGQLTRLHDANDDGEADFYECVCNDWHTGPGEHSYDTCLETDPQGNFYFFKTGDTDLPSGGCLLKVSKDGSKVETFATGFRHPIGLGMSPTGIVTGADQEGNWMPATRIDQYKPGGFYGDMRAHHRQTPPTTYDPPLCWLPREVDNSAGGQVWVPKGAFGPLSELPLHLSYGRCRPYVLLRQEFTDGTVQGGVAPLPISFLSGSCRGRFDTAGDLWVCGLNGWQTAAKADGSLQRVRYTGKPLDTVAKLDVVQSGVKLTFTRPLDKATAENPANYKAAWWGYRWSGDYGSKRWRVSNPNVEGQDEFLFTSAKLLDEKTVLLTVPGGMRTVMQMQVGYNVTAKGDAAKITGSVFLTAHKSAKE